MLRSMSASPLQRLQRRRAGSPRRGRDAYHQGRVRSSPVKSGGRTHSPHPPPNAELAVLSKLLKYLRLKDLLCLRMVCKDWNELICDGETAAGLWAKCHLYFDATNVIFTDNSNRGRAKTLTARFDKFWKSSLITEFKCPNYHFYSLDGRFEIVRKFFYKYGKYIQNLRLNHCILSLVSFQRILQSCPQLEVFEITGMFHCIGHTESLFSSKKESSLTGLINVRKLYFESTFVARLIKRKIRRAQARVRFEDELEIQNLHPTVVREILLSATKLESVTFSGFGIATVNRVLNTLSHYPFHHKLVELGFRDIPDTATPSCLSEMDDLSHLKLKKFAMTFLGCEGRNNLILEEGGTGVPLENLDGILRKLLLAHHRTLESLELTNCNVTEAIFLPSERLNQVPALRKLCLHGTHITELSENSKYVLRNYIDALRVTAEEEPNGPMSRRMIDEIIDAALEDERINNADASGTGLEDDDSCGAGSKGNFLNCDGWDVFWLASALALGILGGFFVCTHVAGETTGKIVFFITLVSIIALLGFYRLMTRDD